ncbi:hypothetical protein PILCRDRAFT_88552 [Piloderma croceum F 1598]|uniref:Uncharacterized protein n=1 Tax=Piloderma croceum (strain F 1598) TaxID=765440 RepID=A0A0C3FRW3_PILCF|nr:hypothetical protein PILCRDRAFT_88552 [Piloderma croceum F 1598]
MFPCIPQGPPPPLYQHPPPYEENVAPDNPSSPSELDFDVLANLGPSTQIDMRAQGATEPIQQRGPEAFAASNSGSVPCNEAHNSALRIVQYEALIWVVPSPKKTSGWKNQKAAKLDPIAYGPAEFLTQIAGIVDSSQHLLTVSCFKWRWQKPANSIWVLLRDENGYLSFLRKIREPWALSAAGASSLPDTHVSEPDDSDDDTWDSRHKRPKFDDKLENLVSEIDQKYSKLVWAAAIRKGTATITSIPIGSNLFSTQHAAKKLTKPKPSNTEAVSSDSPTIPTTPAPAPPSTPFHHLPYAPFLPSPYVYPPYYPFTPPNFLGPPSFERGGPLNWGNQPPQPPSSPPPAAEYSVNEFCEAYDISFAARTKLDQLGFEMGDDLSFISEAQYESIGFKHLEWGRVLKAYRKFKRDRK